MAAASFSPKSLLVVQEFEQHLKGLSGPMQACQAAATDATNQLLGALCATEAELIQQSEQLVPSIMPECLTRQPRVLLAGLAFAKEHVCRISSAYLASLHASQLACVKEMEARTNQSIAYERLLLAKESAALEAQRQAVVQHRIQISAAADRLHAQIRNVWQPMVAERRRLQAHMHACEVEVVRYRAALAEKEAILLQTIGALEGFEENATKALEQFQPAKAQLTADQEEIDAHMAEIEGLAQALETRSADLEARWSRHVSTMQLLGEQGELMGQEVQQLQDIQVAASMQACSQAAKALEQLGNLDQAANGITSMDDKDCESSRKVSRADLARLSYLVASQQLAAAQESASHAALCEGPPTPGGSGSNATSESAQPTKLELQELEKLAIRCRIQLQASDIQPGWVWSRVLKDTCGGGLETLRPGMETPISANRQLRLKLLRASDSPAAAPGTPVTLNGNETQHHDTAAVHVDSGSAGTCLAGLSPCVSLNDSPMAQHAAEQRGLAAPAARSLLGRALVAPQVSVELSLPASPSYRQEPVPVEGQQSPGALQLKEFLKHLASKGKGWEDNHVFELARA